MLFLILITEAQIHHRALDHLQVLGSTRAFPLGGFTLPL